MTYDFFYKMSLITFFQGLYDENIEALAEFVGADPKNIGRNIYNTK